MTDRTEISTAKAPPPRGTYAQGVRVGQLLFCATQLPIDPVSGDLAATAGEQARQCLANLDAVCRAAGTELREAVSMHVYFVDRDDLAQIEEAFAEVFVSSRPARVPVHVPSLAAQAQVSIDATVACR